ncbi:MAG TPA: RNA polymerase sigma factor [Solirubrobacteraceae bacterium]|jgi:RNA polymerase sigma factor (sigma-70 family)|nr:RNA polymerase sigma factor [Solirubrobacteraceae bacterium]
MDTTPIVAAPAPKSGLPVRLAVFGDERLARLVGSGSERAFATLYERYHQQLYRYCRSILREDSDAEDALQSTLASAFVALKRGQRDAPLRPWLFRIAHNEAISLLRRRRADTESAQAPERVAPSAEDRAGERARLAVLVADLQQLPERQRGALVMRELSGLSHEDIAIALETSVGVAKQAIFEARRALMEFAEGRSMQCEDVRRAVSDGDRRVLRARRVRAHLSDCGTCAAFTAAIPARREDLQALMPVLAPAASAAMLASITGVGSGHGATAGAGAMAAGTAGKTVMGTIAAKVLVGAAVLVAATAGVTGVRAVLGHHAHPILRSPHGHGGGTAAGGGASGGVMPIRRARGSGATGRGANDTRHGTAGKHGTGAVSSSSAPLAGGLSTGSQAGHKGLGSHRVLPSQAHGKPVRTVARGHVGGSKAVARRRGNHSSSAGPAAGHHRGAPGSHSQGAGGSHAPGHGSGPSPAHVPKTPAPPSPSRPAHSSAGAHPLLGTR